MNTPSALMEDYARRLQARRFDEVAPLIAPDALFWFTDGSFSGIDQIRRAFEQTWDAIRDEEYRLQEMRWIALDASTAACTYTFHWKGRSPNGDWIEGRGRGTNVLRRQGERWVIQHEHLSAMP